MNRLNRWDGGELSFAFWISVIDVDRQANKIFAKILIRILGSDWSEGSLLKKGWFFNMVYGSRKNL